ncbi:hypothetical protein [Nocardia seriolae]|uniref:Uncharacterized protein n=1 Tax=Nocardia seriolae TaxID=37332 RepID=A0A0B8N7J7_9NOCA|nr:hypothetical protein [Nocardia seriolae]APA95895.1 hypothetical protein NS506_01827 [Nocardia seriolae]MTJ66004.1 hypothetical protein [Nocardia seriolae]MTJ75797.1 hypothetical protein [Nocardia seriolae]MTJ86072.1 hypothetical protein [Nocardia seriolae]MTK30067.1 hypothetical protein [Nocardia seriolae]
MTTTVMLLGLKTTVVDAVRERLDLPDIEIRPGTGPEDFEQALAETSIDHVIMGAALDLEDRLRIVRAAFELSDHTTVHMKDFASGPEGFEPFACAVLVGLHGTPNGDS